MSALTKYAGLLAGLSTVAVLGVAVAQSQPPNPLIPNHPIAAGQQSTQMTPMGETGVLAHPGEMRTATIVKEPEVAVVAPAAAPAPEPVAAAPVAPEPVAVAPAPAPVTTTMGAAPQAAPEPEPMKVARADRG